MFNRSVKFLVDTGADISLLPPAFKSKAFPFSIQLRAANGQEIQTYGCVTTSISIPQLRRSFDVKFVVAQVSDPILGADFFKQHKLLIDVSRKSLIDQATQFTTALVKRTTVLPRINVASMEDGAILAVLTLRLPRYFIVLRLPRVALRATSENTKK